jgi:hypothetical protein
MRRHLLPCSPVDDQGIGTQPAGSARRIHRGVAPAVNRHAAPDFRRFSARLDGPEKLQGVVDFSGIARGDILALAQMRADCQEDRVKAAGHFFGLKILDLVIEHDLDAKAPNTIDLRIEHMARQPVLRDTEVHHAAGQRTRLVDDHRVTQQRQVPCRRQAARARADHEHPLAGGGLRRHHRPAFLESHVAQEALDSVDAHWLIDALAVARVFARVIADPPVDRRQGIVADDDLPGVAIAARLCRGEPGLHVLSGRTRVVTWRQAVDVKRTHRTKRRRFPGRLVSVEGPRHEATPLSSGQAPKGLRS